MAERKAVNKYYPPEWEPKKGSINKFRGSHPLRERARKLHQGILVIRFEMPYNIWCEGCNNHIGTGVRYNAEKSKTGMYYTTPIYKFRMKCHLCDSHFEMQTDPKNLDYVILNGARRQERRWDPKDNEQIVTDEKEVINKLPTNAMFKLEHEVQGQEKVKAIAPVISQLQKVQDRLKDDFSANQMLRNTFRVKKKELLAQEKKDQHLLAKTSLNITLQKESEDDVKLAGLMKLEHLNTFDERREAKRQTIAKESIFSNQIQVNPIAHLKNALKTKKDPLIKTNITQFRKDFKIKVRDDKGNRTKPKLPGMVNYSSDSD